MPLLQSLFVVVGGLVEPRSNDLPIPMPSPYIHDPETITLCDCAVVNKYALHTMQLVLGDARDCPPPPVASLSSLAVASRSPPAIEGVIFGMPDLMVTQDVNLARVYAVVLLTLVALVVSALLWLLPMASTKHVLDVKNGTASILNSTTTPLGLQSPLDPFKLPAASRRCAPRRTPKLSGSNSTLSDSRTANDSANAGSAAALPDRAVDTRDCSQEAETESQFIPVNDQLCNMDNFFTKQVDLEDVITEDIDCCGRMAVTSHDLAIPVTPEQDTGAWDAPAIVLDADQDIATHPTTPSNELTVTTDTESSAHATVDPTTDAGAGTVSIDHNGPTPLQPDIHMDITQTLESLARKKFPKAARPCKSYRNRVKKRAARALEAATATVHDLVPSDSQTILVAFDSEVSPESVAIPHTNGHIENQAEPDLPTILLAFDSVEVSPECVAIAQPNGHPHVEDQAESDLPTILVAFNSVEVSPECVAIAQTNGHPHVEDHAEFDLPTILLAFDPVEVSPESVAIAHTNGHIENQAEPDLPTILVAFNSVEVTPERVAIAQTNGHTHVEDHAEFDLPTILLAFDSVEVSPKSVASTQTDGHAHIEEAVDQAETDQDSNNCPTDALPDSEPTKKKHRRKRGQNTTRRGGQTATQPETTSTMAPASEPITSLELHLPELPIQVSQATTRGETQGPSDACARARSASPTRSAWPERVSGPRPRIVLSGRLFERARAEVQAHSER